MTPQLRFPEFTDEWQVNILAAYLEVSKKRNSDGKFTKNDVFSVSGDYGVVNQIELQGRSFAGASVLNYHVVDKCDIVYTKSPLKANPYGIIKYNPGSPGIVSTLYAVYKPRASIDSKFIDYYFQLNDHTNKYLRPLVHKGSKNDMKINNQHVLSGEVVFPGTEEQEKITDFFTAVDKRIATSEQKLELLQKYKKGVMQKIFTQTVRFKDANGSLYPEWEEKRFGEIVEINPKIKELPDNFIYIDLESVQSGTLLSEKKVNKIQAPSRAQRLLEKNDILFQTVRPYQRNNLYFNRGGDYVASTGYAQLRHKQCPEFIYQLIHTDNFVNEVLDYCTGTNYPAINSSDLSKVIVVIPKSNEEQQKIATFLIALDDKIKAEQTRLTAAKQWKKGLLQRMFV